MRLPVAAKIALHSAGANGGTPGSPTPLGCTSIECSTMCTRVSRGDSSMRAIWKSLKFDCSTRPSFNVISPYFASERPITAAPSICERTRSGLTQKPQSTAVSTRGIEMLPLASTSPSTHGRDVGDERAVRRDAEPPALRQRAAPAGPFGRQLCDLAQPSGVDLERAFGLAVVPPRCVHLLGDLDDARRADHFE